jgi:hypothetical protein
MNYRYKIVLIALCFTSIIGCKDVNQKVNLTNERNFGLLETENDSLSVELKLSQFNSYNDLIYRAEDLVCKDSIPKITFKTDNELKRIYFRNPCWEGIGCILIKSKNKIVIHNDTINKADENFFPLDSLANVLKRDYENNGKNNKLSDSPEKLLIFISYDNNGIQRLPKTLEKLTQTYEEVTGKRDLKIWLNERIELPPPPPMNSKKEIK